MSTDSIQEVDRTHLNFKDIITQFKEIETHSLSGNLIVKVDAIASWMFSFNSGRLAWISGGINQIDRWERSLKIANFNLALDPLMELSNEVEILSKSHILAHQLAVQEVLFDLIQICEHNQNQLSYQLIPIDPHRLKLNPHFPLLKIKPMLTTAIQAWQAWQRAKLADYFPCQFPNLRESAQLSEITSIDNSIEILLSIDGNKSLRTLAIYHGQNLLDFTKSLLPLLQSQSILFSASSFKLGSDIALSQNNLKSNSSIIIERIEPLIACIDDSILVYKNLEKILTAKGYRSYSIQDPLKVIPTLIKNKPDLIFLDLLMPISNGYEVCEQIRKTPSLRYIPVVILTAKNSLFDRVHAKLVGANEFLGKPISQTDVLRILQKYVDGE